MPKKAETWPPTGPVEALYVGPILVEVYDDFVLGWTAETANGGVLGVTDLGFDLCVRSTYDREDDNYSDEIAIREVMEKMRYALARCLIFGRMRLVLERGSDEAQALTERVWSELPEGFFEITPALAEERDQTPFGAIRRADAFTGTLSRLEDAEEQEEERPVIEAVYVEHWPDTREYVLPVLEAETERVAEEAERLRGAGS
jgi:hypothetical protein